MAQVLAIHSDRQVSDETVGSWRWALTDGVDRYPVNRRTTRFGGRPADTPVRVRGGHEREAPVGPGP